MSSISVEKQAPNINGTTKKEIGTPQLEIPIVSEIGIIYPPPEVRSIIDKTAEFVHKNGIEFEEKIRQKETQNAKFNFLNRNDPYFKYYKHILYEFTLYPNREKAPPKPTFFTAAVPDKDKKIATQKSSKINKRKMIIDTTDPTCPTSQLEQFEYVLETPPLSASDLDLVKITAQFVAKNGRKFLQSLLQREMKNYIFDFLKPQHNIYPFFTKLVEQYVKILAPSNDTINLLKTEASSAQAVLERVHLRFEWIKYNDKERKKDETGTKDKTLQNMIDWHEFVVVETISFREDEHANLPQPVSLEQLGARLLAQERHEKQKNAGETNIQNLETVDKPKITVSTEPPVRKDYDPKKLDENKPTSKPKTYEKMLISPITGELIPADKMDQHLKQSLIDPRYKEQKQKHIEEKRQQDLMASAGPSITDHLKDLAQRRSDIFGPGHEETIIGKKLDEKEDPHVKRAAPVHFETKAPIQSTFRQPPPPPSMEKQMEFINSVRNQAMNQNQHPTPQSISNPATFLPPPLKSHQTPVYPSQHVPGSIPQVPYYGIQPVPTYKMDLRPKFDEDLIPEAEFLSSYGLAPINVQVQIPNLPDLSKKNGWQLQGQIEHLTINLTDTISSLKSQLLKTISLPVTKQKILIGASRFGKDSNTLAFYNVHSNTYIALHLKERGGKK
ncbi:hypothetical protein HZS_6849 [Henneguya salminicola]|nr:hypothetical protein HZS_6849 [Henneguya salminicola]